MRICVSFRNLYRDSKELILMSKSFSNIYPYWIPVVSIYRQIEREKEVSHRKEDVRKKK